MRSRTDASHWADKGGKSRKGNHGSSGGNSGGEGSGSNTCGSKWHSAQDCPINRDRPHAPQASQVSQKGGHGFAISFHSGSADGNDPRINLRACEDLPAKRSPPAPSASSSGGSCRMPPSPYPAAEDPSVYHDCPDYFIGTDGDDDGCYDEHSEDQAYDEHLQEYDDEERYRYPCLRFRKGGNKGKGKGKGGKTESKPKASLLDPIAEAPTRRQAEWPIASAGSGDAGSSMTSSVPTATGFLFDLPQRSSRP
eukprot:6840452-Pyramimonas_sp.AAC.1